MAKTAAATVTPLRPAGDSSGISPAAGRGLLVTVPLDALAPHPRNRTDLGDLAVRDALAAGRLSVADALELHKLTGNGGADVITDTLIGEAVTQIAQGYPAAGVIRQAQAELRRARAAQATREKLERDGIMIVTEQ